MNSKQNPALTKILFPILIWGVFFLLFTYFRWDLGDSIMSLFEFRIKAGADFNTDSAVMNYLSISNGRIMFFMMIILAGICSGFIPVIYGLISKIKNLESELSEIKQKLNV